MMLIMLVSVSAQAKGWDQQQYKQIEQSIRMPQFANKDYVITKFGAKQTNTAAKTKRLSRKPLTNVRRKVVVASSSLQVSDS